MRAKTNQPERAFSLRWLTPPYWPTWLMVAGWRTLALLPWHLALGVGALIGLMLPLLSARRRRITRCNIAACNLDAEQKKTLERRHFQSLGMGFTEAAAAWWRDRNFVTEGLGTEVGGRDMILDLQRQGKGILLLPLHYTFLELLPGLVAPLQLTIIPRPHNNPLLEYVIDTKRHRWAAQSVDKDDPWSIMRALSEGGICVYFVDQDYGRKGSIFAPFFGVQASTAVLGRRMAQRAGAAAVLLEMRRERGPDGRIGYRSHFHRFDAYLEAKTDGEATALLHARFEEFIRRAPEQWLWSHRRFKTRPPKEPDIYPPPLAKRRTD